MAQSQISVNHWPIVNGRFSKRDKPIRKDLGSLDDVVNYFTGDIGTSLASIRAREMSVFTRAHPTPTAMIDFPWHIKFFEHPESGGESFTLGTAVQTDPLAIAFPILLSCDWDKDLTRRDGPNGGSWNDVISSIECVSYSKFWLLCEDINFRGKLQFGVGDHPNLGFREFDNKTSSIIMSTTSVEAVKLALEVFLSQ